ncbi:DUF4270 domain-containing protein [Halosquirtibacter xylanolyticus]|uniref:DUF4270 family protein n=1 Tax=Halosquirtibacter xylanolyticus TaxID=3374599 RepID=UPI003749C094|nr:DUF4270 domain-containing protein [Prolixibacteraceae bacterium]
MQRKNSIFKALFIFLIFSLSLSSCMDDGMGYELGDDLVDDDSRVVMIDTVAIDVSTFMLDSLVTTNTERVTVGNLIDPMVGTTTTQTRVQFICNFYPAMESTAEFDSITMILHSDGYFYGDTLSMQDVEVYPLDEYLDPDDYSNDASTFYNTNTIYYDPQKLLGKKVFRPSFRKDSTLSIPLDKELGKRLFNLAYDQNDSLINVDEFKEILPGIVIVPGAESQIVTGFEAPTDSISSGASPPQIKIYYHDKMSDEALSFSLQYTRSDYMYNTFTTDYSGTSLEGLKHDNEVTIPTNQSDDVSYVQGGNGLVTRLNFRDMKDLQYIGPGMIASAILTFKPLKGSFNRFDFRLPTTLSPYIVDKKNKVLGQLLSEDGESPVMGYLFEDAAYEDNTEYRIDITSFIKNEFREDQEWDRSLILQLTSFEENRAVDRLVIDNGNQNNIELILYYIVSE